MCVYIYTYIYQSLTFENCFNSNKIKLEFLLYNMPQNKTNEAIFKYITLNN